MPTSSYMPDLKCEIAFDSGFSTPAASRTWTDVSAYVELAEGLNITFGRGDERSTADANQLSLTLDNSDGRFTAGRPASPYYPNVKLDRPIRVLAAPIDPPAGMVAYWPLQETSGATADNRFGTDATYTGSPTLGAAGPFASDKAVDLSGSGQYVTIPESTLASGAGGNFTVAGWVRLDSLPPAGKVAAMFAETSSATTIRYVLYIADSGAAVGGFYSTGWRAATSAALATPGVWQHWASTYDGATVRLYLGGAEVATFATATTLPASNGAGYDWFIGRRWDAVETLDGRVAHVAVWNRSLSAAEVAGLQGFRPDATVLFQGYINEWPTEWDGTDAYAKAAITASSRLARLGTVRGLRSLVETEILVDSPVAYYPLGDPEGATRADDVSGNKADPLVPFGDGATVVFGNATGPGTDDLTAATFAGGQWLAGGPATTSAAGASVECFMLTEEVPAAADDRRIVTAAGLYVGVAGASAAVAVARTPTSSATGTTNICDGQTHHLAATWDGTTLTLYVDGVVEDTTAVAGSPQTGPMVVGGEPSGDRFTGVVAHAASFATELDAARVAAHAGSGLSGFAGETTDERLERYAGWAHVPSAEIDADTGTTTVVHINTTDLQVVELMRRMEATEGGVLFDALDGTLTFHNRSRRYTATSAFTLNMSEHEVESDYSPKLDRSQLLNDVSGTGITTGRAVDEDSIEDYGYASGSVETQSEDDDEPLNFASWLVYTYATPKVRVPSLSVDVLAQVGKTPNSAAVLAASLGDKVTVSNHPAQAAATSSDYFIEGGTLTFAPESVGVTWNVSASAPYDQVLIVGDAARGVVGTNPVAF